VSKTLKTKHLKLIKTKSIERRVILIQNPLLLASGPIIGFIPSIIRNAFNSAFNSRGITEPVVATITRSCIGNIVVTTTIVFNTNFLLNKEEV
jgi:hypothetical protein